MNKEKVEINEIDIAELARLIKEGFTIGILDSQTEEGVKHISWELKTNVWIE